MSRWIAFALSALLVAGSGPARAQDKPQDKPPERPLDKLPSVTITRVDVKGSGRDMYLQLSLETDFPKDAVFSFVLKNWKHDYDWREKEFRFGNFDRVPAIMIDETAREKKFRVERLPVPMPGTYELCVMFDPRNQTSPDAVKKALGRSRYYHRDLSSTMLTLGDAKSMMQTLMDDTDDCHRLITKTLELLTQIEKESEDKDWDRKAPQVFEEVSKLRGKAVQRMQRTLHHATYKMIDELLEEVGLVGAHVKTLKAGSGRPSAGTSGTPPPVSGTDELPSTHTADRSAGPILPAPDGKRISLEKTKEHIKICDTIRLREYFSWQTLLLADSLDHVNAAYAAFKANGQDAEGFRKTAETAKKVLEEVERAFRHVEENTLQKPLFEEVTAYPSPDPKAKDPEKFSAFFKRFNAYIAVLIEDAGKGQGEVPESVKKQQEDIKAHLDAARVKAMGTKKKKDTP